MEWDVLLLQDVSVAGPVKPAREIEVGAHVMHVGNYSWRACCVVVNLAVAHAITSVYTQGRYPVVILNTNGLEWSAGHAQMLLMSAHFPCEHANRDNDDQGLFDALGLVSGVLSRSDRMRVTVGLDANVKLPVSVSEPVVCANSPHARQLTDRRALLFEQLLQTHSARVLVDPSLPAEELVTHRHWRTQRLNMMDCIIDTARARAPGKSWVEDWCADSVHRPVVVCLESCHVSPKFHKRRPKNWTCNAPLDFNHQIAESCQAASDFGLDALTKAVSEAAREHGTSQRLVLRDSPDDEALLRALNTSRLCDSRLGLRFGGVSRSASGG